MSPRCPILPKRTPTTCSSRARTASSSKWATRPASPRWPRAGAGRLPTSISTDGSISSSSTRGLRWRSGATRRKRQAASCRSRSARRAPNRDAVGAWIEVKTGDVVQRRELTIGGGHVSGKTGWHHFGLGGQAETEIRVLWPDGEVGEWQTVAADGFYLVERGKGPRAWKPGEGM
ncbi:MAG: ASPIC/UnbV domain-containing protein [Rhizobium sp.]|nr:ASPIC/UnbV domain-containing protein [Rhizobium sp.]